MPKLCIHFEEIHSRVHGNFEGQSSVLESSVSYYNYIIKAEYYYYYISGRNFLEECDKQEHLEVTVAATASC